MAQLVLPDRTLTIKAAGLDVDGVLRNTGIQIYQAVCDAVTELGGTRLPTLEEFLLAQAGILGENSVFEKCGVRATDEEIHEAYGRNVLPHDEESPFDDVGELLETLLSHDVKMFVVSRHETLKLAGWFKKHGFHRHINHLRGDSSDKALHIQEICASLGVEPGRAFYAGDWGNDMRQAVRAGLMPIGVTRGYEVSRPILFEAGAVYVVDHLDELTKRIKK